MSDVVHTYWMENFRYYSDPGEILIVMKVLNRAGDEEYINLYTKRSNAEITSLMSDHPETKPMNWDNFKRAPTEAHRTYTSTVTWHHAREQYPIEYQEAALFRTKITKRTHPGFFGGYLKGDRIRFYDKGGASYIADMVAPLPKSPNTD